MTDPIQAAKGDWDALAKQEETKGGSGSSGSDTKKKLKFMKFDKPGNYRIRLIGDHVEFLKHFTPISAITHKDWKDKDPCWKAGFYPRRRYAIHVIDRADGELKILERGAQLFKKFSNYKAVKGINPAGKDGPDFVITIKMPKDKNGQYIKRSTEYEAMPDEKAPLTDEEKAMIKSVGLNNLSLIYRTTALEKIQEMWDALPADKKIPPKKDSDDKDADDAPVSKKPDTSEKMKDSPADAGEDIFAEKDTSEKSNSGEEPLF